MNPNFNTYTLKNGLRVIHRPSDSTVVYCGYQIAVGSRHDAPGEEGMAHFCEHVCFKGTERRTAIQIINSLESVGGELNAFTGKEDTSYYAACLKEHFPKAVDLLSDIVFHSTFPQQEIDKEVEVICDEIDSYEDSPSELICDDFDNLLFEGHPLGHNILGSAGNVRCFTTEDAKRFTSRYYVPQNAIFFCYGDIDFKRLVAMLEKYTPAGEAEPASESNITPWTAEYKPQEIVRQRGTHQAHVMIGVRAFDYNDRRRMPLYLLTNMLGGYGMNARLNLALRERRGLVYSVWSTLSVYGDTGMWSTYFGCAKHDVAKCRKLVRRELDRVMEHKLTESQLRAAKKQIKGQIALSYDNKERFALSFGKSFLHYGWEKDIELFCARIDAVTAEEIQDVAREMFQPERLTTLVFE